MNEDIKGILMIVGAICFVLLFVVSIICIPMWYIFNIQCDEDHKGRVETAEFKKYYCDGEHWIPLELSYQNKIYS